MATFERKTNLFEKLAPLWAILGMVLYIGSTWAVFFKDGTEASTVDNYITYYRLIIWAVIVIAATLSFAPTDATAIVRHVMFWLVSAGVCIAVLYFCVNKYFEYIPSRDNIRLMIGYPKKLADSIMDGVWSADKEEYVNIVIKDVVICSFVIVAAVGAFAAIKLKMSMSGWMKKRFR